MREKTVEFVIRSKLYFLAFKTDTYGMLAEQLMNGGYVSTLEIKAISELYNFRIFVSQLSKGGEVVILVNNTQLANGEGLTRLYNTRHRVVYYNLSTVIKSSPWIEQKCFPWRSEWGFQGVLRVIPFQNTALEIDCQYHPYLKIWSQPILPCLLRTLTLGSVNIHSV